MILFRQVYPPPKFDSRLSNRLDYALSQVERYRQLIPVTEGKSRQRALVNFGYWRFRLRQLQKQIPTN